MKTYVRPRNFNPSMAKIVWERDEGLCIYCGSPAQVLDHVVPFSKGGPTTRANAVCACHKCNREKNTELDMDFLTRGLFWLMQCGENTDWVDKLE